MEGFEVGDLDVAGDEVVDVRAEEGGSGAVVGREGVTVGEEGGGGPLGGVGEDRVEGC